MRRFPVLLAWLVAGCTAHNPDYTGNSDLSVAPQQSFDMAGPADLQGPMGSCGAGQRKCAGTGASDVCQNGQFVVDRQCPAGSTCMETYCAPPATMLPTQIGQRCDVGGPQEIQCAASRMLMLECQPFIDPDTHQPVWYCDTPVGAGGPGTSCKKGSECKSGFCGDNGLCFRACQSAAECGNGGTLQCSDVTITVEGIKVQTLGCTQ